MLTEVDERQGVVKTTWQKVRERVAAVNPEFAQIVDTLEPDDSFPLYLAYFPYGELIGDTKQAFFPTMNGGVFSLDDKNAPKDLVKHLGYGANSQPMGMLLEKEMECFIDLKDQGLTIPWCILQPGSFFPLSKILRAENSPLYFPNGLLVATAGVRSCFMLPHIGSTEPHAILQRDFNIRSPAPKTLYEQWNIFKEIANSSIIEDKWHACILYFSEKWIDMLQKNKKWQPLRLHLHELAWQASEYSRARINYDVIFSMIQKKRNLKPNPYLADTARHIFDIALGVTPGYAPAHQSESMPIELILQAYTHSYQLKNNLPIVLQPVNFAQKLHLFVYYSLIYPSTYVFSPKSQKGASTLVELRDLEHILSIYKEELCGKETMCLGTDLSAIAKNVSFSFYHNKADRHNIVRPSSMISEFDQRFLLPNYLKTNKNIQFPTDAPFVRGCISIQLKET